MSLRWPQHNINSAPLDYTIDWRRWLNGRTIVSASWTVEDADGVKTPFPTSATVNGLLNNSFNNTDTVVTIYLSGGSNNVNYTLYCTIVPSDGAPEERAVTLRTKA